MRAIFQQKEMQCQKHYYQAIFVWDQNCQFGREFDCLVCLTVLQKFSTEKCKVLVLHFDLSVVQEKVLVYSCPDYHYYPRKSVLLNNAKAKQSKYHVEAIIIQIGFQHIVKVPFGHFEKKKNPDSIAEAFICSLTLGNL